MQIRRTLPALLWCVFSATGLWAQQKPLLTDNFGQQSPGPDRVGRGECLVSDGMLHTKEAYACFGDTAWKNYQFTFRAMAPGTGDVHICAGFRAANRDDRYILGLKGGSFNALYLERMGFMGTDDYLAMRPLAFAVKPGEWYRFRVEVAGDRVRIFLGDETLPRIDIRDPNTALCPAGRITLGGSYVETVFDDLQVSPLKENALDGRAREWEMPAPDKEKQRRAQRAAYRPLQLMTAGGARTEMSLEGNWLFCPGYALRDPDDAIEPSKEDDSWHVLHVPDFWNPSRVWLHGEKYKGESKGASDKYYQQEIDRCQGYTFDYTKTNIGWYRQWIELPAGVQGKHMELSFDAVSKVAEVWVNGKKAGSHIGMFGDFTLDVSTLLQPGKNLVTVKVLRNYVNDIKDADKVTDVAVTVEVTQRMIKDLAHGFFVDDPAGIWQPVKLTITDPLHISDVFIKPGRSGAAFEVTVKNEGTEDRTFALSASVMPEGNGAPLYNGTLLPAVTLRAGQEQTLTCSVDGLHPRLWSPEDPNLYRFYFAVGTSGNVPADSLSIRSGFRTFEAKDGFFYLNGRRYWLRGANQTAMPLGANNARLADRFCQLLHAAHINATRTHTVPFTETWMDAADRNGIGVSYEGTWPWLMIQSSMPSQTLLDLWEKEYLDLLKKYRNHPSLLLWTVNNEMKFYDNDPDLERAKTKMRIISGVVGKMRKTDPTRPIVFDSNYDRKTKRFGTEFYKEIDDGDVDDIHMYPNWYDNSIFDQFNGEFQAKFKNAGRPLISQEMSTGYSNNETGHPVRFYTFVHQTPQALVGKYAYDYNDPSIFLKTHAFITRELAEAFRRTDDQASGILHFASITWFRYVYSPDSIQPYPVYYAMQKALQPLLVSAELWGRHFYAGTRMPVRVCIVNDEDESVLASPATLHWELDRENGSVLASGTAPVDSVPYYGRKWLSPDIRIPSDLGHSGPGQPESGHSDRGRVDAKLVLRLMRDQTLLSSNDYDVVLASKTWALDEPGTAKGPSAGKPLSVVDFNGRLSGILDTLGVQHKTYPSLEAALTAPAQSASGPLVLSGLNAGNTSLDDMAKIRTFVSSGGKVLLLNPGTMAAFLYPRYIKGLLDAKGEIMNMDIPESPVFDGLEPLDLRYFNNNLRESPAVCAGSFQIFRQLGLSAPASFTRVHGYLQGEIGQRQAALEKLRGFPIVEIEDKGRVILSQVLLDKAGTDPVAGRLLANMINVLSK
jgi:beta-galactosidase